MNVVLASHNEKKAQELQALLASYCPDIHVSTLSDIGFTEEIVEDGVTFLDNAMLKAMAVTRLGHIAIADDSGLIVDALQGAPGVFSARYASEPVNDVANREKLLRELAGVPYEQRTAHFFTSVVCTFPDGRDPILCNGRCDGIILEKERGENGFGYDSVFYYPDYDATFAELTPAQKASVSHRGRAMRALAVALSML